MLRIQLRWCSRCMFVIILTMTFREVYKQMSQIGIHTKTSQRIDVLEEVNTWVSPRLWWLGRFSYW